MDQSDQDDINKRTSAVPRYPRFSVRELLTGGIPSIAKTEMIRVGNRLAVGRGPSPITVYGRYIVLYPAAAKQVLEQAGEPAEYWAEGMLVDPASLPTSASGMSRLRIDVNNAIVIDESISYVLADRGIAPNRTGPIQYAVQLEMTGKVGLSGYGTLALFDIYWLVIPAQRHAGAPVKREELCLYDGITVHDEPGVGE